MKKAFQSRRIMAALIVFFALCGSVHLGASLKVTVIVNSANIRIEPSLDGVVISSIKRGAVLLVLEKLEDWYRIELPPGLKGSARAGYIHASVVAENAGEEAPQPPPAENVVKESEASEKAVSPETKKPAVSRKRAAESGSQALARPEPRRKKLYIRLGGGYASKKSHYDSDWNFALYQENGSVTEAYDMDMSGTAYETGIGYMFTRNVGVELSFAPAAGKTRGVFSASFPHPFYYGEFREKSWEKTGMAYSASELDLNLVLSFPVLSKLAAYVTVGGAYFLDVKIETLKSLDWSEYSYPYANVSVSPQYATYSKSAFGFNGGAGLDFRFSPAVALNVQARYSSGEAKIDVEGTEVAIEPGGLRATAGIKFAF